MGEKLATRSVKEYATHIPILIGLAQLIKVEQVLELGCGAYSTLTFLDRLVFPSLIALGSLDTKRSWVRRIRAAAKHDPRLRGVLVPGPMAAAIPQLCLEDYDLIFVDDSDTNEERVETIKALTFCRPKRAIVVIHDFEVGAYQKATDKFQQRFIFKTFTPQTGIVWNGDKNLAEALMAMDSVIENHASLEVDDVKAWHQLFFWHQ